MTTFKRVGDMVEKLRFIDLFCGVGGFRSALERNGHQCVFSSDLDKDAQHIYERNFREKPMGDITKISASEIPSHEVICGGFPCQPFSISGNHQGFMDGRGTLLHEILRITKYHQPKVLLLENVKNYQSHDGGKTLAITIRLLEEANYQVNFKVLNASRFGIAQKRERIYFVCFRKDLKISNFSFPEPSDELVSLEDLLLCPKDPRLKELIIERSDMRLEKILPKEVENRPMRIGTVGKGGQGERVYSTKGHAITLSAFGGGIGAKTGMYLVDGRVRRLHPEECRRLMGFPEDFYFHRSRNVSFKLFGNSVIVPLVSKIFHNIERSLFKKNLKAA